MYTLDSNLNIAWDFIYLHMLSVCVCVGGGGGSE